MKAKHIKGFQKWLSVLTYVDDTLSSKDFNRLFKAYSRSLR